MKRRSTFLILTIVVLLGSAGATQPQAGVNIATHLRGSDAPALLRGTLWEGAAERHSTAALLPAPVRGAAGGAVAGAATRNDEPNEPRIDVVPARSAAKRSSTPVRSVSPLATPDPAAGELEPTSVAPEPATTEPEPEQTVVASDPPVQVTEVPVAASPVPVMTPAEIARAEAALRDGQARMSRARTRYRLAQIAQTEQLVRDAEAKLERVRAESVPAKERTAAEKEVRVAEANVEQLRAAGTTTADVEVAAQHLREIEAAIARGAQASVSTDQVAAAEIAVRGAEAKLQALQAGPDPERLGAAQMQLDEAQRSFEAVAAEASARKLQADQQLIQATEDVRLAQDSYAIRAWQNEQAQAGLNPLTSNTFEVDGLDAVLHQQDYAVALAGQEQQVAAVQAWLVEAQALVDQAREHEVVEVASAQTALDMARAQLDELQIGFGPAVLAQLQTEVDALRAHLLTLQQQFTTASVASTVDRQRLDAAQAQLAVLHHDVEVHATAVLEAQTRLDAAKLHIEEIAEREKTAVAEAQAELDAARVQLAQERQRGVGAKGWMWPTFGTLTSGFGLRNMQVGRFHNGVDIANTAQIPVGAARAGTVIEAGWCDGYGYCVKLEHAGGWSTEYGHLADKPPVRAGQVVEAGTIVGSMGTTYDAEHGGYSTGVHLHFTLRRNGKAVDPLLYLP